MRGAVLVEHAERAVRQSRHHRVHRGSRLHHLRHRPRAAGVARQAHGEIHSARLVGRVAEQQHPPLARAHRRVGRDADDVGVVARIGKVRVLRRRAEGDPAVARDRHQPMRARLLVRADVLHHPPIVQLHGLVLVEPRADRRAERPRRAVVVAVGVGGVHPLLGVEPGIRLQQTPGRRRARRELDAVAGGGEHPRRAGRLERRDEIARPLPGRAVVVGPDHVRVHRARARRVAVGVAAEDSRPGGAYS